MGKKKYTLFPFKTSNLDYIQRDVVAFIQSPDYQFVLPEISPQLWRRMTWDHSIAERLEFLGDSLMHSYFSDGLNEHFPDETPGFYTHVRCVLEANSTFAHLMIKAGSSTVDSPVKTAGDTFESIMAAFHREQGADIFGRYFRRFFTALILRAGHACKVHRSTLRKRSVQGGSRASMLHLQHSVRHGTNIGKRLAMKTLRKKTLAKMPIRARQTRQPSEFQEEPLKITEVIDLTKDDDWDDIEILDGPGAPSSYQTQKQSHLPRTLPPNHTHPLSTGLGCSPQYAPSEINETRFTSNSKTIQDHRATESSSQPSRPDPFLLASSEASGNRPQVGIVQGPSGSRSTVYLTRQSESAMHIVIGSSMENPIVID